jgi:predicted metal-dependent phosphotriesterase family hydrolase
VESFREFLLLVESEGFDAAAIRRMTTDNPQALFRIAG